MPEEFGTTRDVQLEELAGPVERARGLLVRERAVESLNARDASLWSVHQEVQRQIEDSLGWLDVA